MIVIKLIQFIIALLLLIRLPVWGYHTLCEGRHNFATTRIQKYLTTTIAVCGELYNFDNLNSQHNNSDIITFTNHIILIHYIDKQLKGLVVLININGRTTFGINRTFLNESYLKNRNSSTVW
jgi:hypothetical protein